MSSGSGLMIKKLPPPAKTRVGSFADSIRYAMRGVHDASIEIMPEQIPDIGGQEATVVDSYGISSLATAPHEMDAVASLSKVRDPVVHLTFLYGTSRPTRAQIIEDIVRCKQAVDLSGHQHIAILHSDAEHNWHLHVVTNRVGPDGKAATLSQDYARMEHVATRINWERGWDIIAGNHNASLIKTLAELNRKDMEKAYDIVTGKDADQSQSEGQRTARLRRAKRLSERSSGKARPRNRERVRFLSECRLASDGGREPAQLLQIDGSPDRLADRRLRVADADARRIERERERHSGISSTAKQAAENRGVIPWQDLAGPIIQAAFARHQTFRDFAEDLAEKGIEVALTDIPGKVPGVAFRCPKSAEGCSGTKAGVPRKMLAEKFSDVGHVPDLKIKDADIRDPAFVWTWTPDVTETITRNHNLKSEFEIYKFEHERDAKARYPNAVKAAWAKEQKIRTRTFKWIRRWKLFRDAAIRSYYGRGRKARADKQMMLETSERIAAQAKAKAKVRQFERWEKTKVEIRAKIGKPEKALNYLAWLKTLPPSATRDAEIAAISRGKPQRVPTMSLPEPAREIERAKPKIDEKKKGAPVTIEKPDPAPEPAPATKIDIVEELFGALLAGRLDEAMEAAARARPADREKIIAVRNFFNRPLSGSAAQQAIERDRRKRAAAIMVERAWSAEAALDEIDQIDRSAKSRRQQPADKSRGKPPDRGGIGD